jgi:hypothetical protein
MLGGQGHKENERASCHVRSSGEGHQGLKAMYDQEVEQESFSRKLEELRKQHALE